MKNKKNKLSIFLSFAIGLLLFALTLNGAVFIFVNAAYNVQEDGMFTETSGGHTYKFYHITDEVRDEEDAIISNPVAVAWGEAPSNATGTITIPSTITSSKPTGSSVTYNVIAIRKAGFSRCDFTNVVIPQTIREFGEEAFAYCEYITSVQIPKYITVIPRSAFLDCRELTTVYYSRSDGTRSTTNATIRRFEDHAFDSCVKLDSIQCPSTAIFFGESCFQKTNFNTFRLPYDNGYADVEHGRNEITIEKYAFADCPVLQNIYFDVNTTMIEDYAFADSKTDLTFYYCGHSIPTFAGNPLWRNKKITTNSSYSSQVYNVIVDQERISPSTEYPGLFYYFSSNDVPLDNARTTGTSNTTSVYVIQNSAEYAVIANFETPDSTDWRADYYDNGVLTIPNEIEGRPVKIIANNAFQHHSELTTVYLNSNLVQIQHHAFYHSNNISLLDFSACTNLLEISYSIFNEVVLKSGVDVNNAINSDKDDAASKAESNINRAMTTITFPNCLRYIGNFAFFNFGALRQTEDGSGNIINPGISFKTDPSKPSDLRLIGDYAFANYSESIAKYNGSTIGAEGTIDLVLPYSLSDADAAQANIFHAYAFDRKYNASQYRSTVHEAFINRYSINRNCFEYQNALRSVKMERGGTPHETSFASNSFARCTGIVRFESNANICLIGKDIFKNDKNGESRLREVFLEADTANNNSYGINTPWNIFDGSNVQDTGSTLFSGANNSKEVVVYIKSTNNQPPKNQYYWSYELTGVYGNGLGGSRKGVPIHYVDWTVAGNVKYWHLNSSDDSLISMDINNGVYGPLTHNKYNNGYISFAKKSNGNYDVVRYFTDGAVANVSNTVDLTSNTLNGMTIDIIGEEAFAGGKNVGLYFVFPTTVTTIKERAFQRDDGNGVVIVTFKNGGTIQVPTGSSDTFTTCVSAGENKAYCCLSTSLTRVELDAFYNNKFKKIELPTSLEFIGVSAFYRNKSKDGRIESFLFTDYDSGTSPDTNSAFTIENDGIYYTAGGNSKKVLVYQASGLTGTMTVAANTQAISIRAAANSKYTTVDFNNVVKKVYGQSFRDSKNLQSLTNVSQIKYINSGVISPDTEWVTSSNASYSTLENTTKGGTLDYLSVGAFQGCSNLRVDFSEFTSLVKIGESAFKDCTNIVKFQLSKVYKIYKCTDGTNIGSPIATYNDSDGGVLDLSLCPTLRSMYKSPFNGCTSAIYAITPNTTPSNSGESAMSVTSGAAFNSSTKVLCGETIDQADQSSRVSSNKATTHYNNGSLGGYGNLYFRAHSTADLNSSYPTGRFYWTAIQNGSDPSEADDYKIILFETYSAANTWFSNASNVASQLP